MSAILKKPRRPLTAYNVFFQDERQRLLSEFRETGSTRPDFKYFAQQIALRWKRISAQDKSHYDQLAMMEKHKYVTKLIQWHEQGLQGQNVSTKSTSTKKSSPSKPFASKNGPDKAKDQDPEAFVKRPNHCNLPVEAEVDFASPPFGVPARESTPDLDDIFGMNFIPIDLPPVLYKDEIEQGSDLNYYNGIIPGSIDWVVNELGHDGIYMLLTLFSEDL